MTDLVIDTNVNYDGTAAVQVAVNGPVVIGLTGVPGASGAVPGLTVYSRPGGSAADFDPTCRKLGLGRAFIDLAAGDEYYCWVTNIRADDSYDLTVADS